MIRFALKDYLGTHGYASLEADSCESARRVVVEDNPDAVILDYQLPDGTSLDILPAIRQAAPTVPVVVLTAHGSIELAVQAVQLGADQFLTKPVNLEVLLTILERLLDRQRARRRQMARRVGRGRSVPDPFIGSSNAVRVLAEEARNALDSRSPVLILGETGSGKGVLAAWLHGNGPRAENAFVDINCAGLSREMLESELFGHERGAFTGAVGAKEGLLEVAHHGTVFMDELGDMDLVVQAKLLKVLEEWKLRRLGAVRDRPIDIRLIAATHRDLQAMVRDERFRADLYYRLSVLVLRIPPLRERREDIPSIARNLLANLSGEMGRGHLTLSSEAATDLAARPWPGNIREMRNLLERAVLRARGGDLLPADLPGDFVVPDESRPSPESPTDTMTLDDLERWQISRILEQEDGQVDRAATRLGIGRSTLYQKLKLFQIIPKDR